MNDQITPRAAAQALRAIPSEARAQASRENGKRGGRKPAGYWEAPITVCDSCLQASCWQGLFMCQASQNAGTIQLTRRELKALGREHRDYWKTDEQLAKEATR